MDHLNRKLIELEVRRQVTESVLEVFECPACKAFPVTESDCICFESLSGNGRQHKDNDGCPFKPQKCRNGHQTDKVVLDWQKKLLEIIPHPCKYANYGCKDTQMSLELSLHEETCDYRKVNLRKLK